MAALRWNDDDGAIGHPATKSWRSSRPSETMADALGCDGVRHQLDVSADEGLDAESIDFPRHGVPWERAFKIKIPRGKIVENARGTLSEAEFERTAS